MAIPLHIDRALQLVAVGSETDDAWNRAVLEQLGFAFAALSIHKYCQSENPFRICFVGADARIRPRVDASIDPYDRPENGNRPYSEETTISKDLPPSLFEGKEK